MRNSLTASIDEEPAIQRDETMMSSAPELEMLVY
jgi:hypothetical protein